MPPLLRLRDAAWYALLAALGAGLWLVVLPMRPLFNPDEGRYAEIPREMLAGGSWIVPHLNGLAYLEKPPLQYWATAASMAVFGQNEFGARFYTALCALLSIGVTGWIAARLWTREAAWRAVFILGGMGLFVVLGQLLTLDMSLTLYLTVALAGFLRAQQPGAARRGMLLAWCAIGLGVMTKGLVAALIPAAVLIIYSLLGRDVTPWRRLHLGWGVPVSLGLTLPWHWAAAQRQDDFLQFFFVHEHFARYLTPSADREAPWWFFAMVLLAGSLPWSVGAVRALATGWRRSATGFDARRFLWVWVVFIVGFFSLSHSKLVPYILPVLPAVALLVAGGDDERVRRIDVLSGAVASVLTALLLALVCFVAPRSLGHAPREVYFLTLGGPLLTIAAVLAATGAVALAMRRRAATPGFAVVGFGWCVAGLLTMRAAAKVAVIYSGATLVPVLAAVPAEAPLYSVGGYDQTLPFYLHRTMTLVSYRGEMSFGLAHAKDIESLDVATFVARWAVEQPEFAVMEAGMFERLKSQGLPMRELGRDVRRVAVARP